MKKVGFIGLGEMGYNIAYNINKNYTTFVWNRTLQKAQQHSNDYGTTYVTNLLDMPKICDILLFCLPTSNDVQNIIKIIEPSLYNEQILIDCTSGDSDIQTIIYNKLLHKKVFYFDAPVSGGPEKARLGTLKSMIGGDQEKYKDIEPILKSFSIPSYVGKIGNGCALKSINNILNVSHLCLAAEALSSLERFGIKKEIALDVINHSSGRSLMTEERIPKHIMEYNYNYGFKLGLMNKDVNLALKLIENPIMFSEISNIMNKSVEKYGEDADYTEVAKLFFENK